MTDLTPWLRLSRTRASAGRLNQLLVRYGSPEALFAQSAEAIARDVRIPLAAARRLLDPAHLPAVDEAERLDRLQVRVLFRGGSEYPALLEQTHEPPPLLYVRGRPLSNTVPTVAVVGTRRASSYGREVAEELSRDLASAGVVVVSGLAQGIDTHAHRGALSGQGVTWAVFGCGVDICYPGSNKPLMKQVVETGTVISEYPLGTPPDGWNFPRRNRIVSGLSLGVVVIEGAKGSGALLTAACAVDQNREVFAVPGRISDPLSWGPHSLLRDGARLVHTVDDILAELNLQTRASVAPPATPAPSLTADEAVLVGLLDANPKPMDDLVLESGLSAGQVSSCLTLLELRSVVRRLPGNNFVRARG